MNQRNPRLGTWVLSTSLFLAACQSTAASPSLVPTADATGTQETNAEPTPSDSEPTASASSVGSPLVTWTEQEFDEPVAAVVVDSGKFVAVGGPFDDRAAWTSSDGVTWDRHPVARPSTAKCVPTEPVCIERSAALGPMVRLHDTLYSFGNTEFFNDYIKGVGWRWSDGQDWQVIESTNPIFGGGAFRAVAASDEAIFAVTHAGYPFTERHWLWKPDTSWQPVGEDISPDNPIQFDSAAWRPDLFVAVGRTWDTQPEADVERESTPSVWTSADGATWTRQNAPEGAAKFCSVSATDDAFFALGLDGEQRPVIGRSVDGVAWSASAPTHRISIEPGPHDELLGCSGSVMELESGYLAYLSIDGATQLWTSRDGLSWDDGPAVAVQMGSQSIAAIGDTVVAFGRHGLGDDPDNQALYVGKVSPPEE